MVLVVCSCFQDVTARPSLSLWCAPPSSSPWWRCPLAASCPWSSLRTLRLVVLQVLVLESLSQSLSLSHLCTNQCSCFSASDLCPLTLSRKWWVFQKSVLFPSSEKDLVHSSPLLWCRLWLRCSTCRSSVGGSAALLLPRNHHEESCQMFTQ